MKRRTRITLALAALSTFAFGAMYGLVAHEGVAQQAAVAAVATQTVAESTATAPAQSSSTVTPSTGSSSQRAAAPPVVHSRTRAT
jgi:hypothetical protein